MLSIFKSKSISTKIIALYSSVSVLCIVLLTIVMYFFTSIKYQDAYLSSVHNSFNLSANKFANIIQSTTIALDNLTYTNSSFLEQTFTNTGYLVKDFKSFQEATDTFKSALSPVYSDPNINYKAIMFLDDNIPLSKTCPDLSYMVNSDTTLDRTSVLSNSSSIEESFWYDNALNAGGDYYWFTMPDNPSVLYGARYVTLSFVENYDVTENSVGMFVLVLDTNILLSQIHYNDDTQNSYVVLKTPTNDMVLEDKQKPSVDCDLYTTNLLYNLDLNIYTPVSDMYFAIRLYISAFILFLLIIFILLIVIVRYITLNISIPIIKLSSHMTDNPNLESIPTENMTDDEIKTIYQSYNTMLDKNKKLMVSIEDETAKRKDWEFKMHQMQINPHFIYNTINNITCRLMINGDNDTASTLGLLSQHLRYNFSDPFNETTLENELEQLKNYVKIQKAQYSDKFSFEVDVEEKFKKCKIIKMLLQPLVENAITYGVGLYYDETLAIKIYCEESNDCLYIYISDNFKFENAEIINEHIKGNVNISKKSSGLGTRSIDKRVKAKYGDEYGLNYFNTETETVACIRLPLHYDESPPPRRYKSL